mmetsp:Transcript_167035/g.536350  ORF Transcript_167035/g.536350 Transcript_167035/m.536350 type:complete len:255 (+) Transcript_167035:131-895(+)
MTQVDPETFTGLMQWLRDRGKSALALPLRRMGFGSLSALLAASEPELRYAGCPDDLVAMLLAMKPTRAGSAAPAVTHADGTGGRRGAAAGDDDDEIVDVFEQGAVITLADLRGIPELNGKAGVVVGFEASKQRWIVDLGPELGKKTLPMREPCAEREGCRKARCPLRPCLCESDVGRLALHFGLGLGLGARRCRCSRRCCCKGRPCRHQCRGLCRRVGGRSGWGSEPRTTAAWGCAGASESVAARCAGCRAARG